MFDLVLWMNLYGMSAITFLAVLFIIVGGYALFKKLKSRNESKSTETRGLQRIDVPFELDPNTGMPVARRAAPVEIPGVEMGRELATFDEKKFFDRLKDYFDEELGDIRKEFRSEILRISTPKTLTSVLEDQLVKQLERGETIPLFSLKGEGVKVFGTEMEISLARAENTEVFGPQRNYTKEMLINFPSSKLLRAARAWGLPVTDEMTKNDVIRLLFPEPVEVEEEEPEVEEEEPEFRRPVM